ncbi:MAG: hypothetical protein CMC55_08685 [Flavobacteriaceae bacterium]|nr:hypothetical protein [Flavobacteriaceae bacterium]|tara:strand:+ start:1315 stop:1644 length:330 start_codon:yes stop_codon:yes gene_type:complete
MNLSQFKMIDELDSNMYKLPIFNNTYLFTMRVLSNPPSELKQFYTCEICKTNPNKDINNLFYFVFEQTRKEFSKKIDLLGRNDCICESCITQLVEDSDSFILKYNLGLI